MAGGTLNTIWKADEEGPDCEKAKNVVKKNPQMDIRSTGT